MTRVVQRDLWAHQFPPDDCSSARLAIFTWPPRAWNGLGSQLHILSSALDLALQHKRVLVPLFGTFGHGDHDSCKGVCGWKGRSLRRSNVPPCNCSNDLSVISAWRRRDRVSQGSQLHILSSALDRALLQNEGWCLRSGRLNMGIMARAKLKGWRSYRASLTGTHCASSAMHCALCCSVIQCWCHCCGRLDGSHEACEVRTGERVEREYTMCTTHTLTAPLPSSPSLPSSSPQPLPQPWVTALLSAATSTPLPRLHASDVPSVKLPPPVLFSRGRVQPLLWRSWSTCCRPTSRP